MAIAAIQTLLDLYTLQESSLTDQMSDISMDITLASRQMSKLAQNTSDKKTEVKTKYDSSDDEYKDEMDEIQDEYDMKLSEIQAWETELETKKDNLKVELETIQNYKESYTSIQKKNIQNDFKYGQGAS